jgi:hypothetical protein
MEPTSTLNHSLLFNLSNLPLRTGRSKVEIDQELSELTKTVKKQWSKQVGLLYTFLPVSKQFVCNTVRDPINTVFKFSFLAVSGYICYLLLRGTFAGIEVDFDTNFKDVFSKDKETRLSAGLDLTNGDQAGQFLRDGLITVYIVFKVFFEKVYFTVAGKVINECYKPPLVALLIAFQDEMRQRNELNENDEQLNFQLIKSLENINRFYEHLEEDLKPYGAQPLSYQEILLAPSITLDEEDPV